MLYEHRKLFGILILLVKLPRHLISNYFQYRHCAEKPLVTLRLDIRSEKNIDTTNFFDDLASRASVLCHALRAASMVISKEYPMYRFGFAVRIELFKNDYLAQIVCEDSANDLMSKRLCSVVSGIKFSDGLYLTVSPAKLGLICYKTQRLALRHDLKGDRKEFSAERKYYMYFSNNILSDFYGSRPKKRLSLKRILKNINFT